MKPVILFGVAGGAGFVVDAAVLLLLAASAGPYWGRLASFGAAVLTTWIINRHAAFRGKSGRYPVALELARYFAVCLGGGALNLLTYSALVLLFDLTGKGLVLAVGAGSLAGMALNFTLSRRLVFADTSGQPAPRRT